MEESLIDSSFMDVASSSLPNSISLNVTGDEGILGQKPPFSNTKSCYQSTSESKEAAKTSSKLSVQKSSKALTTKVMSVASDKLKTKCVIPKNILKVKSQKNSSLCHLIQLLEKFDEDDVMKALEQRKSNLENNSRIINKNVSKSFSSLKSKPNVRDTNIVNSFRKNKNYSYEKCTAKNNLDKLKNPAASKWRHTISENKYPKINQTFTPNSPLKKNILNTTIIKKSKYLTMESHPNTQNDHKNLLSQSNLFQTDRTMIPDQSITSLLETPSTSSSSLAPKSATTILQTESDQSQSIKTSLQKFKVS